MAKYDDKSGRTKYDALVPVHYDRIVGPDGANQKHMADIKRDISKVNHADLISSGQTIDTNMTGKPAFISITSAITSHHAALTDYKGTWDEIQTTETKLAALYVTLDEQRVTYVGARGGLASATEGVTREPSVLLENGWEVRGKKGPALGVLPAPTDLSVTTGEEPGAADVGCDTVHGSSSFIGEWAANPNGPWTRFYMGTRSFCHATGLPSGALASFRMCAFGASGAGEWSKVVTKRIN